MEQIIDQMSAGLEDMSNMTKQWMEMHKDNLTKVLNDPKFAECLEKSNKIFGSHLKD